ncbi:MAG: ABC transporter permease [Rhizobiales bacterium]|nr:ABC transporter permease [Hyphomicrobiales bacterium]
MIQVGGHIKYLFPFSALVLLIVMMVDIELFTGFFGYFTKNSEPAIYSRDSYINIVGWHLLTVFIASLAATIVAVSVGIFVTRPMGEAFMPLAKMLANLGQTFPPVAVLALCVPIVGFGMEPILVALFLYGILPIFENTITGLEQVDKPVLEAARGMGLTPKQRLISVELPLAIPVIIAGIRVSTVINIGTVAIGSTVAAKGLGEVIIAGLLTDNMAFVLQGGIMVALLAIVIDKAIEIISPS